MVQRAAPQAKSAALMMAGLLAGMWVLEFVDQLSGERLDNFGIHAQELDGLPGDLHRPVPARRLGSPDQQLGAVLRARLPGAARRNGPMAALVADQHRVLRTHRLAADPGRTPSSSAPAA